MDREILPSDIEAQLALLAPANPLHGLFGPESETWRVAREAALFAGAWRAALLQLAHPWVAQAIADHSDVEHNPLGRFQRTFRSVFAFHFAGWDEVRFLARRLHRLHGTIRGVEPGSGRSYEANRGEVMRWVAITLWDTALTVHDALVAPLDEARRDAYVREGNRFARLFGLHPDELPGTHADMRREMERLLNAGTLVVTPVARRLGQNLLCPPTLPLSRWWAPAIAGLTADWMPEPLRIGFGLPERGGRWGKVARACCRGLVRLTPGGVRHVPSYRVALRRLRGQEPGRVLAWYHRAWTGPAVPPPAAGDVTSPAP